MIFLTVTNINMTWIWRTTLIIAHNLYSNYFRLVYSEWTGVNLKNRVRQRKHIFIHTYIHISYLEQLQISWKILFLKDTHLFLISVWCRTRTAVQMYACTRSLCMHWVSCGYRIGFWHEYLYASMLVHAPHTTSHQ